MSHCKNRSDWVRCGVFSEENQTCCSVEVAPTDIHIDPLDLAIAPDADDDVHGKREEPTYWPVATMTNEEVIEGGIPKVHVSIMEHYQAMQAKNSPYEINPEIKKANFVLVDNRGNVLRDNTEEFKNLLGVGSNVLAW